MRLLLTLMAMAVLAISVGCDKKEEAVKPKPTGDKAAGTAEVKAPDSGDDGSATAKTAETQTVSFKLPGMT